MSAAKAKRPACAAPDCPTPGDYFVSGRGFCWPHAKLAAGWRPSPERGPGVPVQSRQ